MARYDYNLRKFGRGLLVRDADVRICCVGDSKTSDTAGTQQGRFARSILNEFKLPPRSDSPCPWVSIAVSGGYNGTSMLAGYGSSSSPGAWTCTPASSGSKNPGSDGSKSGTDNQNSPIPYSDYNIANLTTRTADANVFWHVFKTLIHGSNSSQNSIWGGDPFHALQCQARAIYTASGNGPSDMLAIGGRMAQNTNQFGANYSADVGSSGAFDVSAAAGTVGAVSVDCGAGIGSPYIRVFNPASGVISGGSSSAASMYITGGRFFRDSSGTPISGAAFAWIGTAGHYTRQMLACIGGSSTGQSPDPYFSDANIKSWLAQALGRGSGNNAPTHWLLATGNNFEGGGSAETSGGSLVSATFQANVLAVMDQMIAISQAGNGGATPEILVVIPEVNSDGYSVANLHEPVAAVLQACAAARGMSAIDLRSRTYGLVRSGGSVYAGAGPPHPPWSRAGAEPTANTPFAAATDGIHGSAMGFDWIARIIWQELLAANGYERGEPVVQRAGDNGSYRRVARGLRGR